MPDTPTYFGPERRKSQSFSDSLIEEIAGRAAEIAIEKALPNIVDAAATAASERMMASVYQSIGKGVVERFMIVVGALAVAAWFYAKSQGWIK